MDPIYNNGAVLYNDNGVGKLALNSRDQVNNLNAELLQGKHANDFLSIGEDYGIIQDDSDPKNLEFVGITHVKNNVTENETNSTKTKNRVTENEINCTHVFDTTSVIKIGNLVIKSSDNGNGILIGIE